VWVHGGDLAALAVPPIGPPTDLLTNESPGLARAWHPVALSADVAAVSTVELLGRTWALSKVDGVLVADPVPYGIQERWGLVWLAPEEPSVDLFDDIDDFGYVGAWLPPARTGAPAGFVADNFLDVAHFPFVHAGTFGAGEEKLVPPYEVTAEPGGCRSV
jgi:hypothetical protein